MKTIKTIPLTMGKKFNKNGKMDSFSDPLDLGFEILGDTNMIINREQLHSTLSL